ncbi:MAG TPA: hypothetical protein VKE98_17490 [Gemmataceae bacterium]|nr:hypothetical protein [Gemmataceae bacterium]
MESVLLELLCRLEALGDEYGELYDSDVRQAMSAAVFAGFIRALPGYTLPDRFAMYRPGGDQRVRGAGLVHRAFANAAERDGLVTFDQRLAAFQNRKVRTTTTLGIEDFFSWAPPEQYDEAGKLIPPR